MHLTAAIVISIRYSDDDGGRVATHEATRVILSLLVDGVLRINHNKKQIHKTRIMYNITAVSL